MDKKEEYQEIKKYLEEQSKESLIDLIFKQRRIIEAISNDYNKLEKELYEETRGYLDRLIEEVIL